MTVSFKGLPIANPDTTVPRYILAWPKDMRGKGGTVATEEWARGFLGPGKVDLLVLAFETPVGPDPTFAIRPVFSRWSATVFNRLRPGILAFQMPDLEGRTPAEARADFETWLKAAWLQMLSGVVPPKFQCPQPGDLYLDYMKAFANKSLTLNYMSRWKPVDDQQ